MELALEAILGQRSAHSLATGPGQEGVMLEAINTIIIIIDRYP
jgi:hypothetical protein